MSKKRFFLWMTVFLLLLAGCGKRESDIPPTALAAAMSEQCATLGNWERADETFEDITFGEAESGTRAVYVIHTAQGDMECGIFRAADGVKDTVRAYLDEQAASKASLSALYPSERAVFEADCFRYAQTGSESGYFYYFAMSEPAARTAKAVLRTVLDENAAASE